MERYHIFKLGLAILFYAAYCVRPMTVNAQKLDDVATENQTKLDESDFFFYQGVQGKPGVDFPVYSHIPRTTFSCREVDSGYYADLETDCQVFHICEENKKISFLCPNGTIFQQSELICEWWFKVNCTNSPSLYEESAEQLREENARRKSSRRVQNHGAVMRMEERSSVSVVKNENRRMYTNHASEYREVDSNDLSRSSSSDFVRNGANRPTPFQKNQEEEKKNQRGRKPVQFQKEASVDNDEQERKRTRTTPRRKPAKQQNQNSARNRNQQRQGHNQKFVPTTDRGRPFNNQPRNSKHQEYSTRFNSHNKIFDDQNQNSVSTTERNRVNNQPAPFSNRFDSTTERSQFSTRFNNQNQDFHDQSQSYVSTERSRAFSTQFNRDQDQNRNFDSTTERSQFSTRFNNQNQNFNDQSQNHVSTTEATHAFSSQFNHDQNQNQNFVATTERNQFSTQFNNQNQNYNDQSQKYGSTTERSRPFSTQFNHDHNSVDQNHNNNFVKTTERNQFSTQFNNQNQKYNDQSQSYVPTTERSRAFSTQFNHDHNSVDQNQNHNFAQTTEKNHFSTQFNNQNLNYNDQSQSYVSTTERSLAFSKQFDNAHNSADQNQNHNFVQTTERNQFSTQFNNQNQNHNDQSQKYVSTTEKSAFSTQFNRDHNSADQNQNHNFVQTTEGNQFSTQFNNQKYNDQSQSYVSTTERSRAFSTQFDQGHNYADQNQNHNFVQTTERTQFHNQNQKYNDQSQTHVSTTERSRPFSTQFDQGHNSADQYQNHNSAQTTERNQFSTQFNNQNQNFDDQNQGSNFKNQNQNQNFVSSTERSAFSKQTSKSANFGGASFKFSEDFGTSTSKINNVLGTQQPLPLSIFDEKKVTTDTKDGKLSTKSDVTRSFEHNESEETQITQETASFYKNSFNRIDQERKVTNPYPNHRTTYSDLKEPKYHSTKTYSTISSVTPQYLTTQPFNSGKPFVGSQVGTSLRGLTTTLLPPFSGTNPTTELFNVGRTDKSLPVTFPTTVTTRTLVNVTVPSDGSFNTTPRSESTTAKVLDHATVYGKFVKSAATTPWNSVSSTTKPSTRKIIHLSKSLFGSSSPPSKKSETEILSVADSYNRGVPQVRFFGKVQTTKAPFSPRPLSLLPETTTPSGFLTTTTQEVTTGFFITKNTTTPTVSSRIGKIIRPRPFQLPPEPSLTVKPVYTSTVPPTVPAYKISSASPFVDPATPEPTLPTPFTTAKPTLPSTFEDVDSMITTLAEMAGNFTEPRPGLVIPPSAGPQTLHTLAVYFANALDGIAGEKEEGDGEEVEEESLHKDDLEKKKLTELLTQMTMDRYNELFSEDETTPTITTKIKEDLEAQHSKGPAQTEPKVRQLAKVFTQALSSYLDNPATFRKVLQEIRPTEPPESDDLGDDELLNFSDADSKSSFPPFYPTLPSVRPTWGYLIALNTSNSISDSENLQGADSQSFISQLNKLKNEDTTKSSTQLPEDHWTTSPDVNHLWKKAFSFDPASINENFGTTEPTFVTTETEAPEAINEEHVEIQYELRALPHIELNSTQVHGILIDFMNTTKNDDTNRLQRILKKLNTTEDEFLAKMKEIESNPLTRRLILLLVNECGGNSTQAVPVQTLLAPKSEILETASSGSFRQREKENSDYGIVDPKLAGDNQDSRALQLLNSLYTIASKFGK